MKYLILFLVFLFSINIAHAYRTEVGFSELPLELMFVAMCESNANQKARGPFGEIGVMQILPSVWLKKSKELGFNIYDFNGNVAFGLYLWEQYGLKPWYASRHCWKPLLSATYRQIALAN